MEKEIAVVGCRRGDDEGDTVIELGVKVMGGGGW